MKVRNAVGVLHGRGLVHGDLRDCKYDVHKGGWSMRVLLVDFDWAGTTGEAQHPVGWNKETAIDLQSFVGGKLLKRRTIMPWLTFFFPNSVIVSARSADGRI